MAPVIIPPKFRLEQIALNIPDPLAAKDFLSKLGLDEWFDDHVVASGFVYGESGENEADLRFNYQSGDSNGFPPKPMELEILDYTKGASFCDHGADHKVSHLGMHVTPEELVQYRAFFQNEGIQVAQEVVTTSHTNPVIAGKRFYNYVIFDTVQIIGTYLKFIVRIDLK